MDDVENVSPRRSEGGFGYRLVRSRKKQLLAVLFSFLLILFILSRIYYALTDDFRLANISSTIPFRPEWDIPELSSEEKARVFAILDQPFFYIGKGAQSYAFLSEDKQYVFKLFKFKHLRPNWLVGILPDIWPFSEYKRSNIAKKERLIDVTFGGYRLGYEQHRAESGLLFIHLNKTSHLNHDVTLFDKMGRKHDIDLDGFVFVVQQTIIPFKEKLKRAIETGRTEDAIKMIDAVMNLYLSEYQKGIYDRDLGALHNTGFIGDRAVRLDLGKLLKEPKMQDPEVAREHLILVMERLEKRLHQAYPEHSALLMNPIRQKFLAQ